MLTSCCQLRCASALTTLPTYRLISNFMVTDSALIERMNLQYHILNLSDHSLSIFCVLLMFSPLSILLNQEFDLYCGLPKRFFVKPSVME